MIHKAQQAISILRTDLPVAGKKYTSSTATPASGIQIGKAGPKQVWDFSMLKSARKTVDSFMSMSQVPVIYKLYFGSNQPNLVTPLAAGIGGFDNSMLPMMPGSYAFGFHEDQ